jgi:hypothetical protein
MESRLQLDKNATNKGIFMKYKSIFIFNCLDKKYPKFYAMQSKNPRKNNTYCDA